MKYYSNINSLYIYNIISPFMKNETIQIDQNDIKKPERDFLLIFSGALFLIVSTISAFLFFENMNLGHSIEINKNEIA